MVRCDDMMGQNLLLPYLGNEDPLTGFDFGYRLGTRVNLSSWFSPSKPRFCTLQHGLEFLGPWYGHQDWAYRVEFQIFVFFERDVNPPKPELAHRHVF